MAVDKFPITEADRAYLAGIIDGEGSIMAHHHKSSGAWMVIVTVANTDLRLIDWLDARWHASVCRQRPGTGGHKDCYAWTVTNRRVVPVLEAALPYLVLKREHAEIALRWSAECRNPGRRGYPPEIKADRERMMLRIRELNRKGRRVPS